MRASELIEKMQACMEDYGDYEVMMPDPLVQPLGTAWTGSIGLLMQTPVSMSPMLLLIAHPKLATIKNEDGEVINPFDNPDALENVYG